jgi:DivIVA domain-containing protein
MELSSRDVSERRFKTATRGYHKEEVRTFLADLERVMRGLEERVAIDEARAERAERELAALRSQIDDLLEEATEARHKIIDEAKREAIEIVERAGTGAGASTIAQAAERAAAIITRADADANRRLAEIDRLLESAGAEAERMLTAAEQDAATTRAEASRVLDDARLRAKTMCERAETERAEIIEEIARLERIASLATTGDLTTLEAANVILRSGAEITIDLRDESRSPSPATPVQ